MGERFLLIWSPYAEEDGMDRGKGKKHINMRNSWFDVMMLYYYEIAHLKSVRAYSFFYISVLVFRG
jgi:hypothetical protein